MADSWKNGYTLTRAWFDYSFENQDIITPAHTAMFCWFVELNNRLGWVPKFSSPASQTMAAIGIKSYNTYSKIYKELIGFGFVKEVKKSINQYTACIIALSIPDKALDKALDNSVLNHLTKQDESTVQSTGSINKPKNKKPINKKTYKPETSFADAPAPDEADNIFSFSKDSFLKFYKENFGSEYYFEGAKDGAKIKSLLKKIEHQVRSKCNRDNQVFTEDMMPPAFEYFLSKAHTSADDWILEHFTLSILDSKFNEIFNKIQNGKSGNKNSTLSPAERAANLYGSNLRPNGMEPGKNITSYGKL